MSLGDCLRYLTSIRNDLLINLSQFKISYKLLYGGSTNHPLKIFISFTFLAHWTTSQLFSMFDSGVNKAQGRLVPVELLTHSLSAPETHRLNFYQLNTNQLVAKRYTGDRKQNSLLFSATWHSSRGGGLLRDWTLWFSGASSPTWWVYSKGG